jgi:hypothetical protein
MMRTVEVVTHCYAEKHASYAAALTAQLSSILLWPPKSAAVTITVCATAERPPVIDLKDFKISTVDVVEEFEEMWGLRFDAHRIQLLSFPKAELFRRGIGRNYAGKASKADVVWFADADYLFGDGCLDALAAADFKGLAFPREVQIHKSHHHGDAELARIKPGELFQPDMSLFVPKQEKFPTGGIIIVDGDTARKGYNDGTKWCEPVDPAKGFVDPREDIAYRKQFTEGATALDLPSVYRLRHSDCPFQSKEDRLAQTAHVQ